VSGPVFWTQVLAEVLASCPVFLAGLWVSHRKLKTHVDRKTDQQTGDIKTITDQQTAELERLRGPGT
jgi:hypothetical protein